MQRAIEKTMANHHTKCRKSVCDVGCGVSLLGHVGLGGADQYLGAAMLEGLVVGIPGTAREVLVIDPKTDKVSFAGDTRPASFVKCALQRKRLKWLRGVSAEEKGRPVVYGIPANADRVLRVRFDDASDDASEVSVSTVEATEDFSMKKRWLFHGAVRVGAKVVCVPACADRFLVVEDGVASPRGKKICEGLDGKFYGGVLGADGGVWCFPHNAPRVARFDCETETWDFVGPDFSDRGKHLWHGGVRVKHLLYGVPSHAKTILKIDVFSRTVTEIGNLMAEEEEDRSIEKTQRYRPGNYKFGGAVATLDDKAVYCLPYDAYCVARIDVETDAVELLRPGADSKDDFKGINKWQNGFCSRADGCIYGIPVSADAILKIDPLSNRVSTVAGDFIRKHLGSGIQDKWEGGVVDPESGAFYAVPQRADCVLKIHPQEGNVSVSREHYGDVFVKIASCGSVDGDLLGKAMDRTGLMVWPARIAVCRWIAAEAPKLKGAQKLLDLGAGCGACSAVAVALGISVTCTDASDEALGLAKRNVEANHCGDPEVSAIVQRLRWGDDAPKKHDVVVASDVVYPDISDEALGHLFQTAKDSEARSFILGFIDRGQRRQLPRRLFCAAHNTRASATLLEIPATDDDSQFLKETKLFRFVFDDDRPDNQRQSPPSSSSPLLQAALAAYPGLWDDAPDPILHDDDLQDMSPFPADVLLV